MAFTKTIADIDPSTRKLNWVTAVAVGVLAYIWVYPLLWILSLSFRSNSSLRLSTNGLFPNSFSFSHYIEIFTNSETLTWFVNSVTVAVLVTVIHLVIASFAGYAFARLEFKGKRFIFPFVIAGLMVPEQAIFIPLHTMFAAWGIHNSYLGLILPRLPLAFGVFLMTQFFRGIPKEIDEAAAIDNATQFQIFYKLILPLSKPALTTLGIFTFLGAWNDYLWPLVSATDSSMYTVTIGLASMLGPYGGTEQLGTLGAAAVTACLPMLIMFIIFQRYIVQGISMNVGK